MGERGIGPARISLASAGEVRDSLLGGVETGAEVEQYA